MLIPFPAFQASLRMMCLLSVGCATIASAANPDEILKQVDEIRNPSQSFQMKVRVTTGKDASVFDVLVGGKEKTLIRTIEPARDRGRDLLMLAETMWVYIPNLKAPVRISLAQKLSGQAANGDISRMRWHGDYDAKVGKETATTWQLDLTARRKGLTYEKIRAFVDRKTMRPQKADYLSTSGMALKTATFGQFKTIAGGVRPTEIIIADAKNQKDKSVITIEEMTQKTFDASLFQKESLGGN